MGGKKKARKQCKSLQKKIGKILFAEEKLTRKIELLKEQRQQLEVRVKLLRQDLNDALDQESEVESSDASPGQALGTIHKIDWKRYTYLHDRYEAHIEEGVEKPEARRLANLDLMEKFGNEAGYTNQQLKCIFL